MRLALIVTLCSLASACRRDCLSAADCNRGQLCGDDGLCRALPGPASITLTPGPWFQPVAVFPAPFAAAAPREGPVLVITNRAIDPSTLTARSFSVQDTFQRDVPGRLDLLTDPPGAIFLPHDPFVPGAAYSIRFTSAVHDAQGNALETEAAWTFTAAP